MVASEPVKTEDLYPVHSRVAWGAVLAGTALALATYLVLTLLGTALGLSINDRVSDKAMSIGAVVYAIVITAWSLFVGGFVASQFTTGENKIEGLVYGFLVWAVVLAVLMMLLAGGVRAGFSAMVGVANSAGTVAAANNGNWEETARRNGATDADIEKARANMASAPESIRDAVNNPANREKVEQNATKAAWYAVLGTVLAMAAAGFGGYAGAGPTFFLRRVVVVAPGNRLAGARV